MNIEDHPTVKRVRAKGGDHADASRRIEADWLRQLALDCGADDAGVVEIERPALDAQRDELLHHYPLTKTLLSFVVRMSREPVFAARRVLSLISSFTTLATRWTTSVVGWCGD
jgi:hypothetical protein